MDVKLQAAVGAMVADINWEPPEDIWESEAMAPPLTRGILPRSMEELAFSDENVYPPLAVAVSACFACAVASSARHVLSVVKDRWYEDLVLWFMVSGVSGSIKSPTMKRAVRALTDRQKHERVAYQRACREADNPRDVPKPKRYTSTDPTIEAISELLQRSLFGMGVYQDEGSVFLRDYVAGQKELKRSAGTWLSAWSAEPAHIDRIGRGQDIYVERMSVSFLGAITTSEFVGLGKRMSQGDGMLARILPIFLPPLEPSEFSATDESRLYTQVINMLADARSSPRKFYRFSTSARALFMDLRKQHLTRAALFREYQPRRSEFETKLVSYVARFALLFHIVEAAEQPLPPHAKPTDKHTLNAGKIVQSTTLKRAANFVSLLSQHGGLFYNMMQNEKDSAEVRLARAIAGYILRAGVHQIRQREIMQHVNEFNDSPFAVRAGAFLLLENLGWLSPLDEWLVGGQIKKGTTWHVNPSAHALFVRRAGQLREIAAEAVQQIQASAEKRRKARVTGL